MRRLRRARRRIGPRLRYDAGSRRRDPRARAPGGAGGRGGRGDRRAWGFRALRPAAAGRQPADGRPVRPSQRGLRVHRRPRRQARRRCRGRRLGAHGYVASDPELGAIFIAAGAGIERGVSLDAIDNVDVAPTMAALLGLDLGTVDGRALSEIGAQLDRTGVGRNAGMIDLAIASCGSREVWKRYWARPRTRRRRFDAEHAARVGIDGEIEEAVGPWRTSRMRWRSVVSIASRPARPR